MQSVQPFVTDAQNVIRFKENKIVSKLLEVASQNSYSLNQIAMGDFSTEDRVQFAMLIGYSVSGFETLSYVSDDVCDIVRKMLSDGVTEEQAQAQNAQEKLDYVREQLAPLVSLLYGIHEDDLKGDAG